MNSQKEIINEIFSDWKISFPKISNVCINYSLGPIREVKDITEYLNNLFNPAILSLLPTDLINRLQSKISELIQYIENNKAYADRPLNETTLNLIRPDSEEGYLQELEELKDIIQQIENIDFYTFLYHKADHVINQALEKYNNQFDEQIAKLIDRTNEAHLCVDYKKQADKVNLRIRCNTLFLALLLVFIPFVHIYAPITEMNNNVITIYAAKLFFIIPLIWMILFTIKNIREDRKIEQTYKHKEVVANTYLNFLNMIDKDRSLDDSKTRKLLSRIAIESMGLNPALLLDKSTAEKIPMEELLTRMMDRASGNSDGASQQK